MDEQERERHKQEQIRREAAAPYADAMAAALLRIATAQLTDTERLAELEAAAEALQKAESKLSVLAGLAGRPTGGPDYILDPQLVLEVVAAAAAVRAGGAFLDGLGRSLGEWCAEWIKKLHIVQIVRVWARRPPHGRNPEASWIYRGITIYLPSAGEHLPDEAYLALIDLDLSDQQLQGKTLHWDPHKNAWLPTGALEHQTTENGTSAPSADIGS